MKTIYSIGDDQKTLYATRTFNAPVSAVWEAWTNRDLLERWWAPRPYKAVTKSFDFSEGGAWHYHMLGPEGDVHWCLNAYEKIEPEVQFTAVDAFCDEDMHINESMPVSHWLVEFSEADGSTTVKVTSTYRSEAELQTVRDMGMEAGFDMGLNQLEEVLA